MTGNNVTIMEKDGYDASKFNAVKHGLLSKEAVLEWEDKGDYESLVLAFEEEYQPNGITETYLVMELAQIVWRKRRLRMAEKTIVKSKLKSCDGFSGTGTIKRAIYGHPDIKSVSGSVEDAFRLSQKEVQEKVDELQQIITPLNELLQKDFTYEEYMGNIPQYLKENWDDWLVGDNGYSANVYSFRHFLQKECIDYYQEKLNPLLVRDAIKYEAMCEVAEPSERLINLSRYETHLDRKFEKTVGMIVKLQELRHNNPTTGNIEIKRV